MALNGVGTGGMSGRRRTARQDGTDLAQMGAALAAAEERAYQRLLTSEKQTGVHPHWVGQGPAWDWRGLRQWMSETTDPTEAVAVNTLVQCLAQDIERSSSDRWAANTLRQSALPIIEARLAELARTVQQ